MTELGKLQAARAALYKYGDHQRRCQYWQPSPGSPLTPRPCTCGFEDALESLTEEKWYNQEALQDPRDDPDSKEPWYNQKALLP